MHAECRNTHSSNHAVTARRRRRGREVRRAHEMRARLGIHLRAPAARGQGGAAVRETAVHEHPGVAEAFERECREVGQLFVVHVESREICPAGGTRDRRGWPRGSTSRRRRRHRLAQQATKIVVGERDFGSACTAAGACPCRRDLRGFSAGSRGHYEPRGARVHPDAARSYPPPRHRSVSTTAARGWGGGPRRLGRLWSRSESSPPRPHHRRALSRSPTPGGWRTPDHLNRRVSSRRPPHRPRVS